MSRLLCSVFIAFSLLTSAIAQETKTQEKTNQQKERQKKEPSKIYWGGQLGLSFGDYFAISIIPMIGYKVTPRFHLGAKIGYAYTEDKRYEESLTSHNYGGSLLSRFLIVRGLYAHAEYVYWSYQYQIEKFDNFESERTWVPFLLLGGGYVQPISPSTALFVEVLWDVLNDENSPYDSSSPRISLGVGVGF